MESPRPEPREAAQFVPAVEQLTDVKNVYRVQAVQ
jgi:hypothetical protein